MPLQHDSPVAKLTARVNQERAAAVSAPVLPPHSSLFYAFYDAAVFLSYSLITCLEFLHPRRKKITNRPLRVFRMSSVIAQGGVAKVCLQAVLATDPEQAHIELFVFNSKFPLPEALAQHPEITVHNRKLQLWFGSYQWKAFRAIFKLAHMMYRARADVVHVHEPQFAPIARMASILSNGAPVFVHLHNDYGERWELRRPTFLQEQMIRHSLHHSHLIACSQTILDAGARWLKLPAAKLHLIEDGTDDIHNTDPDQALIDDLRQAAQGRIIITKMSHIIGHKRIDDFLVACRILLDEGYPIFVLLMCYGKRRARAMMRRQFEVMFAPSEGELLLHVPNAQALLPYAGIGVSASSLEGLGLNILEFQVAGLPVVCTDLQPHREMVEDGVSGLLYETGNVPQLVAQLKRLLDDPALARQIGAAGQQSARQRTWKKTAANTVEFYKSVLEGRCS